MALVRRIGVALLGLSLLGGLTVVASETSDANVGCRLQPLVDRGGVVVVPSGCEEDGPIVVRGDTEISGGPMYITGGFIVNSGASLTLTDNSALTGPVTVQEDGKLALSGSGTTVDGAIWVQPGATAEIRGVGPLGVRATDLINQGVTEVGGLIKLGQAGRGFATVTDSHSRLDIRALAAGSQLWFERPTAPVVVARLVEGALGLVDDSAIRCDVGTCVVNTVPSQAGDLWISLTPTDNSNGSSPSPSSPPPATPTPAPTGNPQPTTLEEAIAGAVDQAVLDLPPGVSAGASVSIADADGDAIDLTLTGGPIKRDHGQTLITVPAGSTLTLRDITVDASWSQPTEAYAPVVEVAPGGRLVLAEGAQINANQSFGVVNNGTLDIVGPDAAIADCRVDATELAGDPGPIGGAGVWNRASGVFWMSGGAIRDNVVAADNGEAAFGGGVLNAGAMRLAGGSVTGNQVDGGGGGVAVVREPGSDHGGRLDVGGDHASVAGAELPTIASNSAEFGGGVAVVDQSEWGGRLSAAPQAEAPDDVPSAILDRGSLSANQAAGAGGAVMAFGGSAVGLDGPLVVSASNRAGLLGTDGVAVADAYLRVSGDVRTEPGGGVALLRQGWPLVLTSGFTGAGQLVIEQVDGLAEGGELPAIRLADPDVALSIAAQEAIVFAIAGIEAELNLGADGQPVVRGLVPAEGNVPPATGLPTQPVTPTPSQTSTRPPTTPPTAAPTQAPTRVPTAGLTGQPTARASSRASSTPAPANPTAGATQPGPSTQARVGQSGGGSGGSYPTDEETPDDGFGQDPTGEETVVPPSPSSASPSRSASRSATASPSDSTGGSGDEGDGAGPNLSAPEPPAGLSSKTIGFSLMAIGIFGLAGLGVYVMRRGGFFAA
jgi:hypothetical protein